MLQSLGFTNSMFSFVIFCQMFVIFLQATAICWVNFFVWEHMKDNWWICFHARHVKCCLWRRLEPTKKCVASALFSFNCLPFLMNWCHAHSCAWLFLSRPNDVWQCIFFLEHETKNQIKGCQPESQLATGMSTEKRICTTKNTSLAHSACATSSDSA